MMDKNKLIKDLDAKVFNDVPLDENVQKIRERLFNFIDTEVVDYEGAPETDEQTKYILINF